MSVTSGKVVIAYRPYQEIGAIHLTVSNRYMKQYLEKGLLYQSGTYLTADELEQITDLGDYN